MNLPQKDRFVHEILDNLKADILKKVDKMPEQWDGMEIRQFISDYYKDHYLFAPLSRGRKKEYENTCLIENLI